MNIQTSRVRAALRPNVKGPIALARILPVTVVVYDKLAFTVRPVEERDKPGYAQDAIPMSRNQWNRVLQKIQRRLALRAERRGVKVALRRVPAYEVPIPDADLLECGQMLTDDAS